MHKLRLLIALSLSLACFAQKDNPFENLKYRFIGPPGNRVSAVAGEPGNPFVYYAGAASGGLWKSSDGGNDWYPVFDKQSAQSIGSIAIAPSNHQVIYVGTGEPWIRSNVSVGDGIYRSNDGCKPWSHLGLEKTGRIGRIVIDPNHPDIAFAAAMGSGYLPQQERGVCRTTDGGKTWRQRLFVNENTGASDITIDPKNPRHLIAGLWQFEIRTWGRNSGGPGSGLFVTNDGGDTWNRIDKHGLPDSPLGKIAVNFAPSDENRVYALIETGDRGSLWRSDNGGGSWRLVNNSRLLNERPHYYTRMLVMPDNANEVYFPSNFNNVTFDGGSTAERQHCPGDRIPSDNEEYAGNSGGGCGGDNHDMWADPLLPNRMMIGSDGGVMISVNRGRSWNEVRLPIAQIYHLTVDNRVPYYVYGQMQDGTPQRGPSQVPGDYIINESQWTTTAGCETGWNVVDPEDNNIVWGGCYAGVTERVDLRDGHARSVSVWPDRTMGANAGEVKERMNWTSPIAISPHDHNTVYTGSQYVNRTTDAGQTWQRISPDLTLNDPSMHGNSGGLTVDNLSVEYAGVVYALAESPVEKGQIWAGTNDGQVQVTRDGGKTWTNVTKNIPGLPEWGTVYNIDASRFSGGTAYAVFDFHQVNNRDPIAYKTTDYGKTWKSIVNGIPKSMLSYAHSIKEDPVRQGMLYLGTENAIYVSFDDGEHWEALQTNLPHAPVYWITVQEHFNDLVIATYGRGFWILDDITPLQQLNQRVRDAAAFLFTPRAAYRFRSPEMPGFPTIDMTTGENPTYGASINYWLKSAPAADVKIRILDGAGQVVRTLDGTKHAGMNRIYWDLRYEQSKQIRLRTSPLS